MCVDSDTPYQHVSPEAMHHEHHTYTPVPDTHCADCGRILPNGSAETHCLECKPWHDET